VKASSSSLKSALESAPVVFAELSLFILVGGDVKCVFAHGAAYGAGTYAQKYITLLSDTANQQITAPTFPEVELRNQS